MSDRRDPVGERGPVAPLPGVVLDRGLAGAWADDAGPDLPGVGVRRGVRRGGVAVGLDDRPPGAGAVGGAATERDDPAGGESGWSLGPQARRPAWGLGAVDR